ncbi:hypothetical protein ACPXCE_19320 [Streptomyces sp. DT24]|uniref:hypothetical protein n=1 Tax=unclassified Streptomyces TaxID=2593676 RepID=UPI0023B9C4C2|nr:hypothetical protein [Streptomyces sp. AM 4-1-1]WEH33953.1 hypothetical protein PZB75_11575 [Streptomyces sp. AM 4-1-1]
MSHFVHLVIAVLGAARTWFHRHVDRALLLLARAGRETPGRGAASGLPSGLVAALVGHAQLADQARKQQF